MKFHTVLNRVAIAALLLAAGPTFAQSFRVQCPKTTPLHPTAPAPGDFNPIGGQIKCQHIGGGDGYATMADGNQIYLFGFAPLSGLLSLQNQSVGGLNNAINGAYAGTQKASEFNKPYAGPISPDGTATTNPAGGSGDAAIREPAMMMNMGVLAANIPAPLIAVDEDDEFFLTLSNVGMIMRPDLFEQHTVHFHGYPNASSIYDGVPDASVAINIGGSFTYYYSAPGAGTCFWHCHITPPEHLQMGMVGQLYVRPRQNRVPPSTTLRAALQTQQTDLRTACRRPNDGVTPAVASVPDILCSNPEPAVATTASGGGKYAYNDGD